jgi:hypothetical protein
MTKQILFVLIVAVLALAMLRPDRVVASHKATILWFVADGLAVVLALSGFTDSRGDRR